MLFQYTLRGQEIIKVCGDTTITVSSDTTQDKIIYVKGELDYVLYDLNAQNISYVVYELPPTLQITSIGDITRYPVVKLWIYRDFPVDSVLMNIENISKETGKCFCDHCRLSAAEEMLIMKKEKSYAIYIKGKNYKLVFKGYPPLVKENSITQSHKFDSLQKDTLDPLDLIIFKTPGDDFHLHVYENVMHNDWEDTVLCYINFFIKKTSEFHKPLIPTRSAPKNTYVRESRTDVYSDEIIAYLKANRNAKLEVIVYCDADLKHKDYDKSLDRTHTVKYYNLVKLFFERNGIPPSRLIGTYMGSSKPVYPNPADQKKHQANNRIRLVLRK